MVCPNFHFLKKALAFILVWPQISSKNINRTGQQLAEVAPFLLHHKSTEFVQR